MNTQTAVAEELHQAMLAIQRALNLLKEEPKKRDTQQSLGKCFWCDKEILVGDRTIREMHSNCYHQWRHYHIGDDKQFKTIEDAERAGMIPPKKKGGRPKKDLDRQAQRAKERMAARHKKEGN